MPAGTVRPPRFPARTPTTDPPAVDVARWRTPAGSACRTWSRNTAVHALTSSLSLPRRSRRRIRRRAATGTPSSNRRPRHGKAAVGERRNHRGPLRLPHHVPCHLNTVCSRRAPDGRGQITTSSPVAAAGGRPRASRRPTPRKPTFRHRPTPGTPGACRSRRRRPHRATVRPAGAPSRAVRHRAARRVSPAGRPHSSRRCSSRRRPAGPRHRAVASPARTACRHSRSSRPAAIRW